MLKNNYKALEKYKALEFELKEKSEAFEKLDKEKSEA